MYIYIYIYVYTDIQPRAAWPAPRQVVGSRRADPRSTPSPPTKSLGFGGFDSSKLLVLKGGNSHAR